MIFFPTIIFASIIENQKYCTMCISVKETSIDNSNIIEELYIAIIQFFTCDLLIVLSILNAFVE